LGLLLLILTLISSYYVKVWTPTTQTKVDVPLEIRKDKLFCPGFGRVSQLHDQWQPQLKVKPKKKQSFTKGKRQVVDEDNSLKRAISGKGLEDDVVTFEDDSLPEKPKQQSTFVHNAHNTRKEEEEEDIQHLFKQFSTSSAPEQNGSIAGPSVIGPPSRTSMFEQQVQYPRIEAQDPMDRQTSFSHFGPSGGTLNQPQTNQTFNQTGTAALVPYGSAATPYGSSPYGNAQGGFAQTYGNNQYGTGQQPQMSFQQNSQINQQLRNAQNDDQFLQTLRSLKTSSF